MRNFHFSKLPTEKSNFRSRNIDRLPTSDILSIINQEDKKVPAAVDKVKKSIAGTVDCVVNSIRKGGRVFFAGAGTSGRLGVLEAAECPPTFNTPSSLIQAVMAGGKRAVFRSKEGAEDKKDAALRIFRKKLRKNDVVIGIAASGVTPFVRGALTAGREKGARTVLISCNIQSPLKGLVDHLIAPKVGPEVITGSTRLKAGTATKLVLNMITVASMVRLGKVYRNWMVDLQPKSAKLKARAVRIISKLGRVPEKQASRYLKKAGNRVKPAILMAREKLDYSAALLKLKSCSGFLEKALRKSSTATPCGDCEKPAPPRTLYEGCKKPAASR